MATLALPMPVGLPGVVRHAVPGLGACVMGTGIIGIAAHTLPVRPPGLTPVADLSWVLAVGLLVAVVTVLLLQAVCVPDVALAHLRDRRTAPATGTLAMAFLTVGTSTLLTGSAVVGAGPAYVVDWSCFAVGTSLGLGTSVAFPLLLIRRREHVGLADVSATWLLPVVPPMVSAAAAGILAQHTQDGSVRRALIVLGLLLFGASLFAAVLMVGALWARLLIHGDEGPAGAPGLWLVLGPLGQGATALNAIAVASKGCLPPPYPDGLAVVALVGGLGLLGFALLWAVAAGAITLRAARDGMSFHLGWWAFTFPVGTCVTGCSGLAARLHSGPLTVAAELAFAVLLAAWLVVAARTAQAVANGTLRSPVG